jgi:ABC-type transport system involved in multi-copper enzyme maturation permease subunit
VKRWLAEFATGLRLGLRGLVEKELRTRSRGWRPMWLLTGYLGALTLAVSGFLALTVRTSGTVPPAEGILLFAALAFGSVLLLAFITPALTTGAISGERERRTLELLLVTRASPLGLVAGKLAGSLVYVAYLLAASLPVFALVYLFGGTLPRYLFMTLAVAIGTATTNAALGLMLSALVKRTALASVLAYLLVIAIVLLVPVGSAVTGVVRATQGQVGGPPPAYTYLSPLTSLLAMYTAGTPAVSLLTAPAGAGAALQRQPALPILRATYLVSSGRGGQTRTVVTWAPWVYHAVINTVATACFLLVATLAISPVKPWRVPRLRRA